MPSPKSRDESGRSFEAWIAATSCAADLVGEALHLDQLVVGQVVQVGHVLDQLLAQELATRS